MSEVAPVKPLLLKLIVIVVATLCARFVKLATPLTEATVSEPCSVPLPALRAPVTCVPVSAERKLPNWSSIRITGCWAKATPAVAVAEGCV